MLSAYPKNQLALGGPANGLCTDSLLHISSNGAFQGNHGALHRAIVRLMPPTQTPLHARSGAPSPEWDARGALDV